MSKLNHVYNGEKILFDAKRMRNEALSENTVVSDSLKRLPQIVIAISYSKTFIVTAPLPVNSFSKQNFSPFLSN